VAVWSIRTVLKYLNMNARYDLLVNRFMNRKMAFNGADKCGKFLAEEEGRIRALRAAAVFDLLLKGNFEDSEEFLRGIDDLKKLELVGLNNKLIYDDKASIDKALERRWIALLEEPNGMDMDSLFD
tara:strand:+ start:169 stop:546 length:378 start_codon:yes stop_codon:yes gene_type:complete